MPTITKKEIVNQIAEKMGAQQSTVKEIVQCFLDTIITELSRNNRLEFRDFGVFEVKKQTARNAHNPKTLEPVKVPAKRVVKFKMGRIMKNGLNGKL